MSSHMDELLLRFLRGEAGLAEKEQVEAWLAESPERHGELEELRLALSLASARDQRGDPGTPPKATDIIFQAGLRAGDASEPRRRIWPRKVWASFGIAAAAACIAFGSFAYRAIVGSSETNLLAAEELNTGAGESTTVRLNDGSVVRLGPSSRLQVMATEASRQVVLEGRAFFAVTHDSTRPFRVVTPAGNVRVLGTRFELRADVSDMRLVVVEGSVALATGDSEVHVETGEMTQVSRGRAGEVVQAPGLAEISDEWLGRFLLFQDTSLEKAAREIEEMYGVEVRLLERALAEKTLTMWFSSRPLDEVMSVVCSVIDASCRIGEGVVTVGEEEPGTLKVPGTI